jgi:hypothetical protein
MSITATPAAAEPTTPCCDKPLTEVAPTPVNCDAQLLRAPTTPTVNRRKILQRMQSVKVRVGQPATITWQFRDDTGAPVSLVSCGFTDSSLSASVGDVERVLVLRIREALSASCTREVVASTVDAETGIVTFELPREAVADAGIYLAEAAVVDVGTNTDVIFSNVFYLNVERGAALDSVRGAPTIAEIRLHLRDSSGDENFLLDSVAFDDAEIAASIMRPVQYWNEVPPDIKRYTTHTFPFRFHWLEAIAGNLFLMAEESFRRNHLEYQAGGIAVNDQNKEQNYAAAAQRRLQAWRDFVRAKKAAMNLEGCFGSVGSDYRF